ncbi:MAG: ATP-binding cassette domain-containing protein [Gammaproteobacteria bacterium]|nr:ATP-binding cassette domain-containing protein [Gammaproteobacteria bacterium]
MNNIIARKLQVLNLSEWNFEIQSGECVFLSGPSGCGKTVLLRAIADLDPHQGHVELNQISINNIPAHKWRSKVALVPAETYWWHETVAEHFQQVDENSFAEFGFGMEVMGWQVSRLSTGEKQRLGLLRACQQQPQVLLLDEPTANLDKHYTLVVEKYIDRQIKTRDLSVIWVTHDEKQIERVATRGWQIEENVIREIKP